MVYFIALLALLFVLAIIMRKIKNRHFKDTKKLNFLVFCLSFDIIVSSVLWKILNKPNTADAANVLIDIGHHIIVMAYVPSITFRTKSSSTFVSLHPTK